MILDPAKPNTIPVVIVTNVIILEISQFTWALAGAREIPLKETSGGQRS